MTNLHNLSENEYRAMIAEIEAAKGDELLDLRDRFVEAGIAVPGFKSLTAPDKRERLIDLLPEPFLKPVKRGATMPKDRKWSKRVMKQRALLYLAGQMTALEPSPMTRQVRRQKDRRASKQPLGMKQSDWHELKSLPRAEPRYGEGV